MSDITEKSKPGKKTSCLRTTATVSGFYNPAGQKGGSMDAREEYWKFAESERHFNDIQAGIDR